MRKLLPILILAITLCSCDDTQEHINADVEIANNSYDDLEESVTSAVEEARALCEEIEDEQLQAEIMEQLDIISSAIDEYGLDISAHLTDAEERIWKKEWETEEARERAWNN